MVFSSIRGGGFFGFLPLFLGWGGIVGVVLLINVNIIKHDLSSFN
jgi:hypothetical protein